MLRRGYGSKRDALLAALQDHMPQRDDLHWTHPAGGLYVWLTLPQSIDTSRGKGLFADCVLHGVLYVPGEYCFQPDETGFIPRHYIRLSFGQVAPDQIAPGIQRLAAAIKRQLEMSQAAVS